MEDVGRIESPMGTSDDTRAIRGADIDRRAAWLADRQSGVASRRQLMELGVSAKAIGCRLRAERWRSIHPGIYLVGVFRPSLRTRWIAALLAAGTDSALSHLSSAQAQDCARERGPVHVAVPGRRAARKLAGVIVHRPRRLDPVDIIRVDGLPVTTLARTLLDLAATERFELLMKVAERAERRHRLDFRAIEACVQRNPGHRGIALLRRLLDAYLPVAGANEGLERDFQRFVAEHGFPSPQCNVLGGGLLVDFWWPQAKLVVELDSREFHAPWSAAERDRERDAKLMRLDVHTLRVTDHRLRHDRDGLATDIEARFVHAGVVLRRSASSGAKRRFR